MNNINVLLLREMIELLDDRKLTISTMESCSGGAIASAISNIPGSSKVFKFGAITYDNKFKIKMGVRPYVLERYGDHHIKTTADMAMNASNYANSDIGIGVSGKLTMKLEDLDEDKDENLVYLSIYFKKSKQMYNKTLKVLTNDRTEVKNSIVNIVVETILDILLDIDNK